MLNLKNHSFQFLTLNILHILNDGYAASIILLLPFLAKDFSLDLTQVGLLGTVFNSLGIICAIPAGYIAKKIGGMKTLIIALFIYAGGYILTTTLKTYALFFPTFLIIGLGFGLFHPIAIALIAKWTTKGTRGKHMGNFMAVGDLGRIGIATLFTFLVALLGWQYTLGLYAIIAISIAILFSFLFLSKKEHFTAKDTQVASLSLRKILTHKPFICTSFTGFFDSFASSSLFIFLPFLLLKRGLDPAFLGSFTAAFFIGNFFGKTVLGRFADKYTTAKVFIMSECLMALFILFLANSTSLILIIICSIILGIFTKGTAPLQATMVSETAEQHGNFEKTFGLNSFIVNMATTLSPIILGMISDTFGIITAFYVMAIISLIAILPAFAFHKTR